MIEMNFSFPIEQPHSFTQETHNTYHYNYRMNSPKSNNYVSNEDSILTPCIKQVRKKRDTTFMHVKWQLSRLLSRLEKIYSPKDAANWSIKLYLLVP